MVRTLRFLLVVTVMVAVLSGPLAITQVLAIDPLTTVVGGVLGTQPDVKLMEGGLMAVVTKRHQDTPGLAKESIVVTPEISPRVTVLNYSDLLLDVALTGSMSNWKEVVVQNSAKPGWELRYNSKDLERQRARDPGDWFRVPIMWSDLEDGVANCISIRLIDKGSHKKYLIGKAGIANPNLLTFTIDVVDRKIYPYDRRDGKIAADPKWGVSSETSHFLLSEEGPWKAAMPDWYDKTVRDSIRVRPPVSSSQPSRRSTTQREASSATRERTKNQWLYGQRFDVEILRASGVKLCIEGDAIVVSSPKVTETCWNFDDNFGCQEVRGKANRLHIRGWRVGTEGEIGLSIKTSSGWRNDVARVRVIAKGGR